MTKREELTAKQDALIALKERIEADDAEAIEEGTLLKSEIETLTAEVEQADKKAGLLESIGRKEPQEDNTMNTEGLKSLDLESLKNRRGSTSAYVKSPIDPPSFVSGPDIPVVSQNVGEINYNLGVRDLFAKEAINGNTLTYFVMGPTTGKISADGIAQGDEKSKITPAYEPVTDVLAKIACYLKETDELLSDAPYLESVVRGRGVFEQQRAVEGYLVNTLGNNNGLLSGYTLDFDGILTAKMDIEANTGYVADAIIINPLDLEQLLLSKDGNQQYMMGGPAYAPYGNGAYGAYLPIWGCKVVASASCPQGAAIIGSFKAGASVVTKANEGLRVEVANENEDDFIKNMITVRIEERILLAVRVPEAFAVLTAAASE